MGDEVQAIKAGLLEVADIVVVNKGDRPGAQRTASQLRAMLGLPVGPRRPAAHARALGPARGAGSRDRPHAARARPPAPKEPEVLVTTATTGDGIAELLAAAGPASRARPRGGRHAGATRARGGAGLGDPRRPAPGGAARPERTAQATEATMRRGRRARARSVRRRRRAPRRPPPRGRSSSITRRRRHPRPSGAVAIAAFAG